MQRIQLQILQTVVLIESEWTEVLELLKKDFWSFLTDENIFRIPDLQLQLNRSSVKPAWAGTKAEFKTKNALTFERGRTRFCNYFDQLYSQIDFETNKASLASDDPDKMHEVAYLLVLSRIGKKLDLQGFHKLHAFAVAKKDTVLVCMMPSGGGKSTLLTELLNHPDIKMLSDDIPLVSSSGEIYPFPLKIGLGQIPEGMKITDPDRNIYQMKRTHYGTKQLICTAGLPGKVEDKFKPYRSVILIEAFRCPGPSRLEKSSYFSSLCGLFVHGVIGIGTPIILEYFWESGFSDFLVKTKIFFKRLIAFSRLSSRAFRYRLHSGPEPVETAKLLVKLMDNYNQ